MDALERASACRTDHHRPGLDVFEFVFDCEAGARVVERYRDQSRTQGGKIGDYEVAVVTRDDRNAVTRLQTQLHQATTQSGNLIAQAPVACRLTTADKSNVLSRVSFDDRREVH